MPSKDILHPKDQRRFKPEPLTLEQRHKVGELFHKAIVKLKDMGIDISPYAGTIAKMYENNINPRIHVTPALPGQSPFVASFYYRTRAENDDLIEPEPAIIIPVKLGVLPEEKIIERMVISLAGSLKVMESLDNGDWGGLYKKVLVDGLEMQRDCARRTFSKFYIPSEGIIKPNIVRLLGGTIALEYPIRRQRLIDPRIPGDLKKLVDDHLGDIQYVDCTLPQFVSAAQQKTLRNVRIMRVMDGSIFKMLSEIGQYESLGEEDKKKVYQNFAFFRWNYAFDVFNNLAKRFGHENFIEKSPEERETLAADAYIATLVEKESSRFRNYLRRHFRALRYD